MMNNIKTKLQKIELIKTHSEIYGVMTYAGKLADTIECSIKRLYIPHYIE